MSLFYFCRNRHITKGLFPPLACHQCREPVFGPISVAEAARALGKRPSDYATPLVDDDGVFFWPQNDSKSVFGNSWASQAAAYVNKAKPKQLPPRDLNEIPSVPSEPSWDNPRYDDDPIAWLEYKIERCRVISRLIAFRAILDHLHKTA